MARKPRQYSDPELKELYVLFHEYFNYNPETGILSWKKKPAPRTLITDTVGYVTDNGYNTVALKGVRHYYHRVCYLMYHGNLPEEIDHIDHDRLNNAIDNLRDSEGNNNRNKSSQKGSSSPYLGVSKCVNSARWISAICSNGIKRTIGRFEDEVEAAKAYDREARKYHKEFANLNFPEEIIDE